MQQPTTHSTRWEFKPMGVSGTSDGDNDQQPRNVSNRHPHNLETENHTFSSPKKPIQFVVVTDPSKRGGSYGKRRSSDLTEDERRDRELYRKQKYEARLERGRQVRQSERAERIKLKLVQRESWKKNALIADYLPNDSRYQLSIQELNDNVSAKKCLDYFLKRQLPLEDDPAFLVSYTFFIKEVFKMCTKGSCFKLTFNQFAPFWLLYSQLFIRDEKYKNNQFEYFALCCKSAQNKRKIARIRQHKISDITSISEQTTNSISHINHHQASIYPRPEQFGVNVNPYTLNPPVLAVPHSPTPQPLIQQTTDLPAINSGCEGRYCFSFDFATQEVFILKVETSSHNHNISSLSDHKVAKGFKTQLEIDGNNVSAQKRLDHLMLLDSSNQSQVNGTINPVIAKYKRLLLPFHMTNVINDRIIHHASELQGLADVANTNNTEQQRQLEEEHGNHGNKTEDEDLMGYTESQLRTGVFASASLASRALDSLQIFNQENTIAFTDEEWGDLKRVKGLLNRVRKISSS